MNYTYPERTDTCTICKKVFEHKWHRVDKRTCSNACRQIAYRNRKAAAAEAILAAARAKRNKRSRRKK